VLSSVALQFWKYLALGLCFLCASCFIKNTNENKSTCWTDANSVSSRPTSDVGVKSSSSDGVDVIWVHFGVAKDLKVFHLESKAWNEADFRVADQRGWKPEHQLIIPQYYASLQHFLSTTIHVQKVAAILREGNFQVQVSNDPGRFICNWTYFHSLHLSHIHSTESVFVHVPAFDVFGIDLQLRFIHALLDAIVDARDSVLSTLVDNSGETLQDAEKSTMK